MKISIREGTHNFRIFIPTVLLCSKTGLKKLCQKAGVDERMINAQYMKENRDKLKQVFKKFKGLELLSVEEAGGDGIKIIL